MRATTNSAVMVAALLGAAHAKAPQVEMNAAARPTITIRREQTIDVRADSVERVARLLAQRDGKNPDADSRCGPATLGSMLVTCNLVGAIPDAAVWRAYAAEAEEMLRRAFAPPK